MTTTAQTSMCRAGLRQYSRKPRMPIGASKYAKRSALRTELVITKQQHQSWDYQDAAAHAEETAQDAGCESDCDVCQILHGESSY